MPRNNILTTEILDFLVTLSLREKKYANVESYLKGIIEIKTDLFGDEAPETHLARLRLANFYVDFTNNILKPGKIYDESFFKIVEKQIRPWHNDHLEILNHAAIYYELTDQYKKAVSTLDKASLVARSKYSDSDYKYGEELTRIAKLQIRLGQYEDAEKNINKALVILRNQEKLKAARAYWYKQ
ncbi:MAG: tetratricopeptide repeat protein [Bacteroidota bacterium]